MITAGLICTLLQFALNETDVLRVKYVHGMDSRPTSSGITSPGGVDSSGTSTQARSTGERIFSMFGFTRLSNEQYLVKLRKEREGHLTRIRELERELGLANDADGQTSEFFQA